MPPSTRAKACLLLNAVLPRRTLTPSDAIELVRRMQRCNYAAYRSSINASGTGDGANANASL